jgi:uncharacterized protein (TIRG00374 family)
VTEQVEHHHHPIGEPLEQEADALINPEVPVEVPPAEQMSLVRRLRQPRTILSIAVPIAIIAIAVALNRDMMSQVPGAIGGADPRFIVVAFLIYYAGFPLRGFRWTKLLRGAGYKVKTGDATEILFLSWFVNCIVPAKLGDLYRAYLVKQNSPVSATRTLGTVFMERILDLVAIAALGVAAGYFRFRGSLNDLPGGVQAIFAFGVVIVLALIVALVVMRNFGRRVIVLLRIPPRGVELYERFEEGVFGSVGLRGLPVLGLLTVMIWATEALRLYFVVRSLGFADVHLGFSGAMFVALIGSLLTAVPLFPGGLGLVDVGMLGVLTTFFTKNPVHATAIVVVDRAISVFSIVILGGVAWVLSSKPRGGGMTVEEIAPSLAPMRPPA